jgi:hypothetical protein
MKLTKILFGFLATIILTMGNIFACPCFVSTAADDFRNADAVFFGKVIEITPSGSSSLFTFKVEKSWKGVNTEEVVIPSGETDCDIDFALNEIYVVYARNDGGQLLTGKCTGTAELVYANEQLKDLRYKPTIPLVPARRNYWQVIYITGAFVLISLLIGFLVMRVRKRAA